MRKRKEKVFFYKEGKLHFEGTGVRTWLAAMRSSPRRILASSCSVTPNRNRTCSATVRRAVARLLPLEDVGGPGPSVPFALPAAENWRNGNGQETVVDDAGWGM
jgi:hypothetical protein